LTSPPLAQPEPAADAAIHLLEAADPVSCPSVMAWIADRGESAWLLGAGGLTAMAEAAGLHRTRCLPLPAGSATWGWVQLRRALRGLPPRVTLHAWSAGCAAATRRAGWRGQVLLHQLQAPGATGFHADTAAEPIVTHVPRTEADPTHADTLAVAEPTLAAAAARRVANDRPAIRRRWRLPDPAPPVVLLLSDPPAAADVGPSLMAINLLTEATGRGARLLVHPRQHGRTRAQRLLDRLNVGDRLLQDPAVACPWTLLHGCDAVLLGEAPAPLSLPYALAAGLPIVAPDLPVHRGLLDGAEQVHWSPTAEPKKLADRLQHRALDPLVSR
jgi:hypothetical protein